MRSKQVFILLAIFLGIGIPCIILSIIFEGFSFLLYLPFIILFLFIILPKKIMKVKRMINLLSIDKSEIMNMIDLFKSVYNENNIDIRKKQRLIRNLYMLVFFSGLFFLIMSLIFEQQTNNHIYNSKLLYVFLVTCIIFLVFLLSIPFIMKQKKKYDTMYKNTIIKDFVKKSDNYTYSEITVNNIGIEEYEKINFDNESYTRYSLSDDIKGEVLGYKFAICDLNTYCETCSRGIGKIDRRYFKIRSKIDVFSGAFVTIDMKKKFHYIKIIQKKADIFKKEGLIKIEYDDFNKKFEVYSDEPNIKQFLTQDILKFILEFNEKYKIDFEIIFYNQRVYIRFFTDNMWETNLFGNTIDKMSIYKYYVITKFIKEFVIKIDRN